MIQHKTHNTVIPVIYVCAPPIIFPYLAPSLKEKITASNFVFHNSYAYGSISVIIRPSTIISHVV